MRNRKLLAGSCCAFALFVIAILAQHSVASQGDRATGTSGLESIQVGPGASLQLAFADDEGGGRKNYKKKKRVKDDDPPAKGAPAKELLQLILDTAAKARR